MTTEVPINFRIDSTPLEKGKRLAIRSFAAIKDGAKKAGEETEKLNNEIYRTGTVADVAKRALAGLAAALSVRELVQVADSYQNIQARLKLVTKNTQELITVENALFEVSQRTRSGFEESVKLYSKLTQSGRELGKSQADFVRFTELVNKSLRISGATVQEAASGTLQLAQALATGKLAGDEFRGVTESMTRFATALEDALGKSKGEIIALSKAQKLFSQEVVDGILTQGAKLDEEFKKMPLTIGQAFIKISNSFTKALGEFEKSSKTFTNVAKAVSFLADNFKVLELAAVLALTRIAVVFRKSIFTKQFVAFSAVVWGLSEAFEANREWVDNFVDSLKTVAGPVNALSGLFLVVSAGIKKALSEVLATVGATTLGIVSAFGNGFRRIHAAIFGFSADLKEFVQNPFGNNGGLDKLAAALDKSYGETFTEVFKKITDEQDEFAKKIDEETTKALVDLSAAIEVYAEAQQKLSKVKGKPGKPPEPPKDIKAVVEAYKNAASDIKDSFDDLFFNVFRNGKLEFDSFLDGLKDGFARVLSEMATLAIAKPILVPFATAIGGSLGLSSKAIEGVTDQLGGEGLGGLLSFASLGKSLISPELGGKLGTFGADVARLFGAGTGTQASVSNNIVGLAEGFNPLNIGAGLAGNFLANSLFGGNRGVGATIGSGLGGVVGGGLAGSGILGLSGLGLGPVGIAAGALLGSFGGNVLGGLFGGKPSSREQAGVVDLTTGALVERSGLGGKKFSQENFDAVTALADFAGSITNTLGGIAEELTIRASDRDGLGVKFGDDITQFFQSSDAAMGAIIEGITTRIEDLPESLSVALENIDFSNVEQALSDIDFALAFDSIFEEAEPSLSAMEQAMQTLDQALQGALTTTERLGLSEEKLNNLRNKAESSLRTNFLESIQGQQLAIADPQLLRLQQLNEAQELRRRDAIALGLDLVEVERLFSLERQQIIEESMVEQSATLEKGLLRQEQTLEKSLERQLETARNTFERQIAQIAQIERGIALSPEFSGTNALGRAQEADRQLNDLLRRLQTGDQTVFAELDNTINSSLDAALSYYGTTAPFLERLSLVDSILEESRTLAEVTLSTEEQILGTQLDQTRLQQELLNETIRNTEAIRTTTLSGAAQAFNQQIQGVSDLAAVGNFNRQLLLRPGEDISALEAINPRNLLPEFQVKAAKFVASQGQFAFNDPANLTRTFVDFIRSTPNGTQIASRFNDIIEQLGGQRQQFARGTGFGSFQGMALVGEQGPELVNFGRPAQIFSNSQSSTLLGSDGSGEAINEAFARYARQSSEETTFLGGLLRSILNEMRELNDNIGIGGASA
jgi:tape measure domain-containing protein